MLVLLGCTDAEESTDQDNASMPSTAGHTPRAAGEQTPSAVDTDEPDLSTPDLEPKALVWIENWSGATDEVESEARVNAKKAVSIADRLKSAGEYEQAERGYRIGMEADPTWPYAPYQLACNYELAGQHDKAAIEFARALELGFDDFPTAKNDDELGQLRASPEFPKQLVAIRKRYIETGNSRIGTPIGVRPEGEKPDGGWPIILLLHGYGDTNLNYLDSATAWMKLGFISVAVPASVPGADGRFIWNMDSIKPTQRDLQAILASPLLTDLVNRKKVFLLGFSQGALHAMLLTAEHPDQYAGVVGLSPGGSLVQQLINPPVRAGFKTRVMFIHGTEEPHGVLVDAWRRVCQPAGWKFVSQTHPGGHHFPTDWDTRRQAIARFLLD